MKYLSILVLLFTIGVAACLDRPASYALKRERCLAEAKTCEEYVVCLSDFPGPSPAVGTCGPLDAGVE